MPDPGAVNDKREEIKGQRPNAAAEEREVLVSDGGELVASAQHDVNPQGANQKREQLNEFAGPSGFGSATAEERALLEASGEPSPVNLTEEQQVAHAQGTRVWNQWDDQTAREIADVAAEQAEAEADDGALAGIRATNPDDDPNATGEPTGPTGATGPTGSSDESPTGPTGVSGATGPKPTRKRSNTK